MIGNTDIFTEANKDEIKLLARCIMSEASLLPLEGKQAVCEVIFNRVRSENYPNTISEVINQPGQFYTGDNGTPTDDCYTAIICALCSPKYPKDMYWFRLDKVDNGYFYKKIGNTYFSTETQTDL